jgi:hypothetical protein
MSAVDLWSWPETRRDPLGGTPDIVGFKVVANDGEIGHVDYATWDADRAHIVVDTGPWILGRKSLIPARAVRVIDEDSHTVQIDLTKDEIRDAPEYHDTGYDAYADEAALYYGGLGRFWG